jgi:DNA-binding CsgD family transcriptional regulator
MTTGLENEDYVRLLACIESLFHCRKLEDFPRHSLAELRKLVECRAACYAELDYSRQRAVNFFDPPATPNREWFELSLNQHPVLNHFMATGDGQALKISDFLSEEAFHALTLYQQAFRLVGVEDEMGFGVQCERRFVLGFSFHRSERSFTERDRLLLNLVRPHVIRAYLQLEELASHQELQHALQTALRENGLGVLILDSARKIVYKTPGVWDKIATHLPVLDDEATLPKELARWVFGGSETPDAWSFSAEPTRLILRRNRQSENRVLLLVSEENSAATTERLARFNLTRREHEVLRWIADGKSNGEIATILGVSISTAKTHVEHVLAKLGVENRTAAAMVLRSVGL